MGIRNWLQDGWRRFRRFRRHEDSYAPNREVLWQALRGAIQRQQAAGNRVWLGIHFPETFEHVQELLADWQIDYEIATEPFSSNPGAIEAIMQRPEVQLILAPLLDDFHPPLQDQPRHSDQMVALMVLERHGDIRRDDSIESFCRSAPMPIELGYFLSLDDPLVKEVVSPTSRLVLEQMGLEEHELITSNLITRRLDKSLRRRSVDSRRLAE